MKFNYKLFTTLFLLFFLFQGLSAAAQTQEPRKLSPEEQLEALPYDSSRIRPYFFIINSNLYRDSAKAIHYIKEALILSKKLNRPHSTCTFLALWADVYVMQNNFPVATEKLKEVIDLADSIHDLALLAHGEDAMGVICDAQGDFPGALRHNIAYLHTVEEQKDTTGIQVAYVNMCVAYTNQKNYDRAIEYAHRTLLFPFNPQRTLSVTKALEMISVGYIHRHQYEAARDSLQKALRLYQDQKNEAGIATVYSVLAQCYPADAYRQLEYALPAQEIWERLAPNNGYSISNLANIGIVYAYLARVRSGAVKDTGAFTISVHSNGEETAASRTLREAAMLNAAALNTRSQSYYRLALNRAQQVSDRDGIMQVSDSLAKLEAGDGHYKEAFSHLQLYNTLYDSIYSQENKNKIAGMEADYKVELSDKQLQINKLALSNQIKIKWLLISSLSLALLILALIYRQSRLRKRNNASLSALNGQLSELNGQLGEANTQLDEANNVKMKFFGILNHDLRSPVANLITLLHLREQEPDLIDEQAVKARTGQITVVAEELLETMEDLLIWSKGQMVQFRPKKKPVAIADLFRDNERKFALAGVSLHFEQPPALLVVTDIDFAKTILRNLTNNAIKAIGAGSAGNGEVHGQIDWKAWEDDGNAWLSIRDNGPGATKEQLSPLFDEDAPIGISNGLGLHIVRDMANAIGCEIHVFSPVGGGLEVRLKMGTIPIL